MHIKMNNDFVTMGKLREMIEHPVWGPIKIFTFVCLLALCWVLFSYFRNYGTPSETKEYPVEVHCQYGFGYNTVSETMDADSVRGNTIYKDGQWIVNKNIINVKFK